MPSFEDEMLLAQLDQRPMVQPGGDPLAPFTPEQMAQVGVTQLPPMRIPVGPPAPGAAPRPNVDQLAPFTPEERAQVAPWSVNIGEAQIRRPAGPPRPQQTPEQIVNWAKSRLAPLGAPPAPAAPPAQGAPPAPRMPAPGATPATPPTAPQAAPAAPAASPRPVQAAAPSVSNGRPAAPQLPPVDAGAKPPSFLSTLFRTAPNAIGNIAGAYGKGGGSRAMGELINSRNQQNSQTMAGDREARSDYANKLAYLKDKRGKEQAAATRQSDQDAIAAEERTRQHGREDKADAITDEDRNPASAKNVTFRNAFRAAYPDYVAKLPPGEFEKLTSEHVKQLKGLVPGPAKETPEQADARALKLYGEKLNLKEKALKGRVKSGVSTGGSRQDMVGMAIEALSEQHGGYDKIPPAKINQVKIAAMANDPAAKIAAVLGTAVKETKPAEDPAAIKKANYNVVNMIEKLKESEARLLELQKRPGAKYLPGYEPLAAGGAGRYWDQAKSLFVDDPNSTRGRTGLDPQESYVDSDLELLGMGAVLAESGQTANMSREAALGKGKTMSNRTLEGALNANRTTRAELEKRLAVESAAPANIPPPPPGAELEE